MSLDIDMRRPLGPRENIFLLGPGGVGKSTLGRAMAEQSGWPLIDLDLEFCARIAIIGPYIAAHGYAAYRAENLKLAARLLARLHRPSLFITASGFLAAPPDSADHRAALALVQTGYGITLLPSLDLAQATAIVVARQLTRGFGFEPAEETRKFHHRFALYRDQGDMRVVATDPAARIATAVMVALGLPAIAQKPTASAGPSTPQ